MKANVVEASVSGKYILWVSADDGPLAFCFECTESELRQLFVALRDVIGE